MRLTFTADLDQTGGELGILNDATSNALAFGHLASAVRGIPVSVSSTLSLIGAHTVAGACPVSGSAPQRMVVSQTEFTSEFYYYGGVLGDAWKINRFEKGNVVNKTSAMQANNPAVTDLATAWANRASLTYGVLS